MWWLKSYFEYGNDHKRGEEESLQKLFAGKVPTAEEGAEVQSYPWLDPHWRRIVTLGFGVGLVSECEVGLPW